MKLAVPFGNILLRTIGVYLVILVGLWLAGNRGITQMAVLDLVVFLLIVNAVQNAMVAPTHRLQQASLRRWRCSCGRQTAG